MSPFLRHIGQIFRGNLRRLSIDVHLGAIHTNPMPKVTLHVCRHTYCSNMANSGMNPKTLQYLMGHADIGVTLNTYAHVNLDNARDEINRVEKAVKMRQKPEV